MPKKSYKSVVIIVSSIVLIVVFGLLLVSKTNHFNGLEGGMIKTFIDLDGDYVIAETVLEEDSTFHVAWGTNYNLKKLDPNSIQIIARDGDGEDIVLFENTAVSDSHVFYTSMFGMANLERRDVTFHKGRVSYILRGKKLKGRLKVFFSSRS